MPLGHKEKNITSLEDHKLCGVEIDFIEDMKFALDFNRIGGFDFVIVPLTNPSYKPNSSVDKYEEVLFPSNHESSPSEWKFCVAAKISPWIDLDSEDDTLRKDSEATLKHDIEWAANLSIEDILLPTPKSASCGNYARCLNDIMQCTFKHEMTIWLRIPVIANDDDPPEHLKDSWELWNTFRQLCDHNSQLTVALEFVSSTLPLTNSLERWFGEPVRVVMFQTRFFLPKGRDTYRLSNRQQEFVTRIFDHAIHLVISGDSSHTSTRANTKKAGKKVQSTQGHPLKPYWECLDSFYGKLAAVTEEEKHQRNHRDNLQLPLQPLTDNLSAHAYEMIEKDAIKYTQYRRAISQALLDMVPNEKASSLTTVVVVVGAGRGELVTSLMRAAEEIGRKLKVYAVEKNPNAVVSLHSLAKLIWENKVTVVACDVRDWEAPEKADILVSDLLGSFGDNELSPECLDAAQRFLKEDGFSIPLSYSSFIQPVSAAKLHGEILAQKNCMYFETARSVNFHSVARLAPPQPVFTFSHPNRSAKINNEQHTRLKFEVLDGTGSALVHGFAGYFKAVLYTDECLATLPSTKALDKSNRFQMYFPLKTPVYVLPGEPLVVNFWRRCSSTKVWYEWCVTSPSTTPIHNIGGRSYWFDLLVD